MAFDWTTEAVNELKKIWGEGHSASQIAAKLGGMRGGPTRSAVIGKVHRLGLGGRPTKSRSTMIRRPKPAPRKPPPRPVRQPTAVERVFAALAVEPVPVVEEIVIPLAERKVLDQLGDADCRWPIGDPQAPDFHFCAKSKVTGLPYCEFHVARAYQVTTPQNGHSKAKTPMIFRGHPGSGAVENPSQRPVERQERALQTEDVE